MVDFGYVSINAAVEHAWRKVHSSPVTRRGVQVYVRSSQSIWSVAIPPAEEKCRDFHGVGRIAAILFVELVGPVWPLVLNEDLKDLEGFLPEFVRARNRSTTCWDKNI